MSMIVNHWFVVNRRKCLFMTLLTGKSLEPVPPARIIPLFKLLGYQSIVVSSPEIRLNFGSHSKTFFALSLLIEYLKSCAALSYVFYFSRDTFFDF